MAPMRPMSLPVWIMRGRSRIAIAIAIAFVDAPMRPRDVAPPVPRCDRIYKRAPTGPSWFDLASRGRAMMNYDPSGAGQKAPPGKTYTWPVLAMEESLPHAPISTSGWPSP